MSRSACSQAVKLQIGTKLDHVFSLLNVSVECKQDILYYKYILLLLYTNILSMLSLVYCYKIRIYVILLAVCQETCNGTEKSHLSLVLQVYYESPIYTVPQVYHEIQIWYYRYTMKAIYIWYNMYTMNDIYILGTTCMQWKPSK